MARMGFRPKRGRSFKKRGRGRTKRKRSYRAGRGGIRM